MADRFQLAREQARRMRLDAGFIAALDQSRGSTPKALAVYGVDESAYTSDEEMFDLVHAMRTRIMTNPGFNGESILGAILFQGTLDREVDGVPTSEYLWRHKRILPFLKIDYGMNDEEDGVQTMKPIPDLADRLPAARDKDVFGTKMRSVIKSANAEGIARVVDQQFAFAREVLRAGLVPIIEPEVDIHAADKTECERMLLAALRAGADGLDGDMRVLFKLTLPEQPNAYRELCEHPQVLRVVALSGGYTRVVANAKLAANEGVIASFSRALSEGLGVAQDDAAFSATLRESIASIVQASNT